MQLSGRRGFISHNPNMCQPPWYMDAEAIGSIACIRTALELVDESELILINGPHLNIIKVPGEAYWLRAAGAGSSECMIA